MSFSLPSRTDYENWKKKRRNSKSTKRKTEKGAAWSTRCIRENWKMLPMLWMRSRQKGDKTYTIVTRRERNSMIERTKSRSVLLANCSDSLF